MITLHLELAIAITIKITGDHVIDYNRLRLPITITPTLLLTQLDQSSQVRRGYGPHTFEFKPDKHSHVSAGVGGWRMGKHRYDLYYVRG